MVNATTTRAAHGHVRPDRGAPVGRSSSRRATRDVTSPPPISVLMGSYSRGAPPHTPTFARSASVGRRSLGGGWPARSLAGAPSPPPPPRARPPPPAPSLDDS